MDGVECLYRRACGRLLPFCFLTTLAVALHAKVLDTTVPPKKHRTFSSNSTAADSPVPLMQDVFGKDYVYVDPNPGLQSGSKINWHKVSIPKGKVKFLKALRELHFDGKKSRSHQVWQRCSTCTYVYVGMNGTCEMQFQVDKIVKRRPIKQGSSFTVFPGVDHQVHVNHVDEECTLLHTELETGMYPWPIRQGWFESSTENTPQVRTAHNNAMLSKQVLLTGGLVPGVFQVSIARFDPRAACEEHVHKSATEVYVGYKGSSCEMQLVDGEGFRKNLNVSGGKVVVVKPGMKHSAWNDGDESCWNINMMFGDPTTAPLGNTSIDSVLLHKEVYLDEMVYVDPELHLPMYSTPPAEGEECPSGSVPVKTLEECEAAATTLRKPMINKGVLKDHIPGCFMDNNDTDATIMWNQATTVLAYGGYRVCGQEWGRKRLVAWGTMPYIKEIAVESFPLSTPASEIEGITHNHADAVYADTTFYLGMSGECRLQLVMNKYNPGPTVGGTLIRDHMYIKTLSAGTLFTVLPGLEHRLLGVEGKECTCLRIQVNSGVWFVPDATEVWWIKTNVSDVPDTMENCQGSDIPKKVLIGGGLVPGVSELSLTRYSPNATCTRPGKRNGGDFHIGYLGEGCRAQVAHSSGRRMEFDLSGNKMALMKSGTMYTMLNEGQDTCWDVNMILGDNPNPTK